MFLPPACPGRTGEPPSGKLPFPGLSTSRTQGLAFPPRSDLERAPDPYSGTSTYLSEADLLVEWGSPSGALRPESGGWDRSFREHVRLPQKWGHDPCQENVVPVGRDNIQKTPSRARCLESAQGNRGS